MVLRSWGGATASIRSTRMLAEAATLGIMRSSPPAVLLIALLASGCRRDGTPPDSGTMLAPSAQVAPSQAEASREPSPPARALEPPANPSTAPAAAEPPPSPKAARLELTFVGDMNFGRYRDPAFVPLVADPGFDPFAEIRSTLASDVVVGNLETPVVQALPPVSPIATPHRFGASRQQVRDHLGDFHVLGLANNHALDLLEDGLRQSARILAEEGIVPIGGARTEAPLHRLETHTAKGWRIGFLAVTTLVNVEIQPHMPQVPYVELADMPATLLPLVERGRADHDLVVVFVHWGDEYFAAPRPEQQVVARRLIDGGVDMVIGHHPHVLQGIERHGDGLIAYSLGNFLFAGTAGKPALMGVLRTAWQAAPEGTAPCESTMVDAVLHPAFNDVTPSPHPVPATGRRAAQVRARIVGLGKPLRTRWTRIAGTEDLRLQGVGPVPASRR